MRLVTSGGAPVLLRNYWSSRRFREANRAKTFCYNEGSLFLLFGVDAEALEAMRKWWNWQTHHLEGVAPKGVGVQIPPSAP
jgi:hypothetical protein